MHVPNRGKDHDVKLGGESFPNKVSYDDNLDHTARRDYSRGGAVQTSIGDNNGCVINIEFLRTDVDSLSRWDTLCERTLTEYISGTYRHLPTGIGKAYEKVVCLPRNSADDEGGATVSVRAEVGHVKPTT